MKKLLLSVLFAAVSLSGAEVETPWNKVFESGKFEDSVKWRTRVSLEEGEGGKFIQLGTVPRTKGKDAGLNLLPVQIEPNTIYKLVITAEVEGPDTIEDVPEIADVLRVSNKVKAGKPLPGWIIMYFNESNKHFSSEVPLWGSFCRKGKFEYVHMFYTPAAARTLLLRCNSYGNLNNSVKFYKFSLEKVEGNVCNVNPDFSAGAHNGSGYAYGGKLWRIVEENGKVILKCNDSWVMGDPVPVQPGEKYTLTVTGTRFGKRLGTARILFLDPGQNFKGKASKEVLVFKKDEFETRSFQFVVPEGVTRLRTSLSRGNFSEVKLIKE